jgi:hypothetical protein
MIEKMLTCSMLHPIFSILQVLLLNLEEKILTVMEYMIDVSRRCWFKRTTVVLILMETESKIVLMLVQTYLV